MKDHDEQVAISDVRDAYLRGEFERCIALCEVLRTRGEHEDVEAALLRARALIPLGRADRALDVLRRLPSGDIGRDESLVKKMLTGVAYARLGQLDRGVELLLKARAESQGAHSTVQADLAVNLGVAWYLSREYARAADVLQAVPEDADIFHARALLYIGWVARERGNLARAADQFERALRRLDACVRYDRYVEGYALYGATLSCAELLRTESWDDIKRRSARFDWSATGLAAPRHAFALASSVVTELRGEIEEARDWASDAETNAATPAMRVTALCRLAALFGRYGERGAHAHFVKKAHAAFEQIGPNVVTGDEAVLSVDLAEELVEMKALGEAETLLGFYRDCVKTLRRGEAEERIHEARLNLVEGALSEASGERGRAIRSFSKAYREYRELGLGRLTAIVALRLSDLGETEPRAYAERVLVNAHDRYWVKARLVAPSAEIRLTDAQADVLRLVAAGRTNKEIATARGISFFRARNVVADLLAIFGATNRAELGRVAVTQGLVPAHPASQRMRLRRDAARVG